MVFYCSVYGLTKQQYGSFPLSQCAQICFAPLQQLVLECLLFIHHILCEIQDGNNGNALAYAPISPVPYYQTAGFPVPGETIRQELALHFLVYPDVNGFAVISLVFLALFGYIFCTIPQLFVALATIRNTLSLKNDSRTVAILD